MKLIDLGHKDHDMAMKELKNHPGCSLGSIDGVYKLICPINNEVTVDVVDADGNDHITQDEAVEYVHKIAPNKSREEIISDIDTNENGRITKKEVKDWIKKQDK